MGQARRSARACGTMPAGALGLFRQLASADASGTLSSEQGSPTGQASSNVAEPACNPIAPRYTDSVENTARDGNGRFAPSTGDGSAPVGPMYGWPPRNGRIGRNGGLGHWRMGPIWATACGKLGAKGGAGHTTAGLGTEMVKPMVSKHPLPARGFGTGKCCRHPPVCNIIKRTSATCQNRDQQRNVIAPLDDG